MNRSKHIHFELKPGIMIRGDPNMSLEMRNALVKMIERAAIHLRESGRVKPNKTNEKEEGYKSECR